MSGSSTSKLDMKGRGIPNGGKKNATLKIVWDMLLFLEVDTGKDYSNLNAFRSPMKNIFNDENHLQFFLVYILTTILCRPLNFSINIVVEEILFRFS